MRVMTAAAVAAGRLERAFYYLATAAWWRKKWCPSSLLRQELTSWKTASILDDL